MSIKNELEQDVKKNKERKFSLNVSSELFDIIERQVLLKKNLEYKGYSKLQWIYEAIKDELATSKKDAIVKNKQLHVCLPSEISKEVEERVEFCSKFNPTFSTKKWIMTALYKKLFSEISKNK